MNSASYWDETGWNENDKKFWIRRIMKLGEKVKLGWIWIQRINEWVGMKRISGLGWKKRKLELGRNG